MRQHLALLAAALLIALAPARSEEPPICTGDDLIATMRQEHPETYKTLRAEADAVPNGQGLFWKIEAPSGAKPSYLFGTVHLTDPRVKDLPAPVSEALDQASTIIVENTEALSDVETAKHLFGVATLMVLPDGVTLDDIIPPAKLPAVKAFFEANGSGFDSIVKLRPYVTAMALSYSPCEVGRQSAGSEVLDAMIGKTAGWTKSQLAGLETMAEQFASMAAIPLPDQVEWLLQAIELAPTIDNITETLVRLYLAQDTGMLLAWSRHLAVESGTERAYASFEKLLVEDRNVRMAERVLAHIDRGNAFIAVGALHLPGKTGLVQLLRDRGYSVTPVH